MPKLRLKVTHTHGGVAYPPGHVIDVDDHTARWLAARDIAVHALSDVIPAHDASAGPDMPTAVPTAIATPRSSRSPTTPRE